MLYVVVWYRGHDHGEEPPRRNKLAAEKRAQELVKAGFDAFVVEEPDFTANKANPELD